MKRLDFHAMGCGMTALLDRDDNEAKLQLDQVPVWFENWEQSLSRFRPTSELNRLNASEGQPVVVSQNLWEVFLTARRMETWTGGLVRPTVLDALVEAGYDRSFDLLLEKSDGTRLASSLRLEAAAAVLDLPETSTAIRMDESSRSLSLREGIHLDFGGIAKGWAAQEAADRLAALGPCVIDAGGDIAVSGLQVDGQAWPIGVRDPFHPEEHLAVLHITAGGIATSGTDYHRWLKRGRWQHHIIDPRTGQPAETDILTATVIAPDAVQAEAAAKSVLILGSQAGLQWLDSFPDLAGLLVLQNGSSLFSARMRNYLWSF